MPRRADAEPRIQTAKTMTEDSVPEGLSVEEFLRDEDLLALRRRQLAALDPESEEYPAAKAAVRAARRAADMTAHAVAETLDLAE